MPAPLSRWINLPAGAGGLVARAVFTALLAAGPAAFAGSASAQDDPADLAFWKSIANSKNPAEYRAYLDTFPNGRFAPLARIRAGTSVPTQPQPAAPPQRATAAPPPASSPVAPVPAPPPQAATAPAAAAPAAAVLSLAKPEWRASEPIAFTYDLTRLPPGSSHRVRVAAAGSPTAVTDHFAFETETLFLTPPAGSAQVPAVAPGPHELRLYYLPRGSGYYQMVGAQPFVVAPMKPGRIEAGAFLSDLGRGEVPFLASYRGKLLEIEGPFRESRTAGDNISISIGPLEGSSIKGSINCLAPLSDNVALQQAAAMKKGQTVVAGGLLLRAETYNNVVTLSPCAASANLDTTFSAPDEKTPAKPQASNTPAPQVAPGNQAAAVTAPTPDRQAAAGPTAPPAPPPAQPRQAAASSPPPAAPPAPQAQAEPATAPLVTIPKPPPAPTVEVPPRLSLSSLRFPGARVGRTAEPHLFEMILEIAAKEKLACDVPVAYQWDTAGWEEGRVLKAAQAVIDDLKQQGFSMRRVENRYDNMLVIRVENPKDKDDRPLLLAFYVEDDKDLYLAGCALK